MRPKSFLIAALFLTGAAAARAQARLYIRGTAVPGGSAVLERFPTATAGKYAFKYHGTLRSGTLLITTTADTRLATRYYAPKLVDSNIVNNGVAYKSTPDSADAAWVVLFDADNYRFSVNTDEQAVRGELFAPWYEAWLAGGCVQDNQGSGKDAGKWQLDACKAMERGTDDPYEWTWTGELRNYVSNVEPKRLKINGQHGWSPKALHPFTQDKPLAGEGQVWYNAPKDYKWAIGEDGYYTITVNVFRETIEAEYLGASLPDGAHAAPEAEADISVSGRTVTVTSPGVLLVQLFGADGLGVARSAGSRVTLRAPRPGVYILRATDGERALTRKIEIP